MSGHVDRDVASLSGVTEYQITSWRELPSLVVARDGDDVVKVSLPSRFQEAIDEAAMRLGEADADAYRSGWARGYRRSGGGATRRAVDAGVAHGLSRRARRHLSGP